MLLYSVFKVNVKKVAASVFFIALAVLSYFYMDKEGAVISKTLKYLMMLYIIATAAWIDWKVKKIPNMLLIALLLVRIVFFIYESIKEPAYINYNLIQMGTGAALCLILLLLCRLVIRNSIGMGDIKLFAVSGLYFGYDIIYMMFFSFLCTAVYSIFLMVFKKAKKSDSVPLGPFVFIGTIMSIVLV